MKPPAFRLDVVPQKKDTAPPSTSTETKKMSGFGSISDVAAAAPSGDVASPVKTTSSARSSAGTSAVTGARAKATEAAKKEEAKKQAVEEALSKVGVEMMKELAQLPYEAWAMFFSDPLLKLDKTQTETLANSYFLIAKALQPEEIASWKLLLAFAALQNTRIVLVKLREHNDREDKMKKGLTMDLEGKVPQVSII